MEERKHLEYLEYLEERAARRIKELDRSRIATIEQQFHSAIYQMRHMFAGRAETFDRFQRLEEMILAYPQMLRAMLDARDELSEVLCTKRSLLQTERLRRELKSS